MLQLAIFGPLVIAAALAGTTPANGVVWSADAAHSNVTLSVSQLFISRLTGTLPIVSATVVTAADSDLPLEVGVVLDSADMTTHDAGRDAALHGDRFFDAARYPTIRFTSDQIDGTNADAFTIHGQLTMRDLTHPIIFATHRVQLGLNGDGKRRIRYEATGGFRRSDYGMTAERGIIGDEVALQVVIEAVDQR